MKRLSRREAIAASAGVAFGVAAAGIAGCDDEDATTTGETSTGTTANAGVDCVLAPEQTEGPYYVPDLPVRRDITEGRPGTPLTLHLQVLDAEPCESISGATVELWHADADGVYSAFGEGSGEDFLRGAQRTTGSGVATFKTIYPGWYPGRTVHIHVKVHVDGNEVHTGQLYFDDALTDEVFAAAPYAARGERDVRNDADSIYVPESMLSLEPNGDDYSGVMRLGVAA